MTVVTRSLLALAAWSSVVAAQPASQTGAAAEEQFDKGAGLRKAGNWKDACVAFEASEKLDPQIGTLYSVAECNEHLGKLATAWFAYREVAQRDKNAKRRARASDEARALAPRLSKLVVNVTPPVPGVNVTMNGADVTQLVGIETPVDLGTYDLAAKAPGYTPWVAKANVTAEGRTVTVAIALQPVRREPTPPPTPTTAANPPPPPPSTPKSGLAPLQPADEDHPHHAHSHRKVYAIATVSLGGGLAIGGFVLGALAQSKWHSATALCPDQACTNPNDFAQANSLADAARMRGNVADVLLAAGAVAVGVGVYLVISSRHHRDDRTALRVAPSFGGVTLSGGF